MAESDLACGDSCAFRVTGFMQRQAAAGAARVGELQSKVEARVGLGNTELRDDRDLGVVKLIDDIRMRNRRADFERSAPCPDAATPKAAPVAASGAP